MTDSDERPSILTTGVGSMPGVDPAEATRIVAGEFAVPHIVELPARGPGADMVGRTLAMVVTATGEFAAETTPTGWRLSGVRTGAAPGLQMRRGAAWLGEDSDRLEELLAGHDGLVKLQVTGPWTLAAGVESSRGARLLADAGACADLAEALAHAVAEHVAQVRRRLPAAQVVLQVDEPGLPVVRSGRLRTASGRGAVRTPSDSELSAALEAVTAAANGAGASRLLVHCCAPGVPFDLLAGAGFTGVSLDPAVAGRGSIEGVAAWWDRGGEVVVGVAPSTDPGQKAPAGAAAPGALAESLARSVAGLWARAGFGVASAGERTWLSPACGLAAASPAWARQVGEVLRRTARMLQSAP